MSGNGPLRMRKLDQFTAILAVLGVLLVLITPALDELPSTAGCKSTALPGLVASSALFAFQALSFNHDPLHSLIRFFTTLDVLSFSCALLC